jgi:hypothetical protein
MADWDDELRESARELGSHLERAHPNPPGRIRLRRRFVAAVLMVLAAAATVVILQRPPMDPVAAIEAQYRDTQHLRTILKPETLDPELRPQFERALAEVEKAIELARDAARRSPENPEFRELCHIAYGAREHLYEAYRFAKGK